MSRPPIAEPIPGVVYAVQRHAWQAAGWSVGEDSPSETPDGWRPVSGWRIVARDSARIGAVRALVPAAEA